MGWKFFSGGPRIEHFAGVREQKGSRVDHAKNLWFPHVFLTFPCRPCIFCAFPFPKIFLKILDFLTKLIYFRARNLLKKIIPNHEMASSVPPIIIPRSLKFYATTEVPVRTDGQTDGEESSRHHGHHRPPTAAGHA